MEDDDVKEKMHQGVKKMAASLGQARFGSSDSLFAHILESLPVGVNIYDAEGSLVYVNKAQADLVGFTREEMIGRKTSSLIPPGEEAVLAKELEKRKKGISSSYELYLSKRDGGCIRAVAAGRPLLDENGNYRGGFAILTDTSTVLDLENALKEKEERLATILKRSPAGIIEMDFRTGRFLSVNDVVVRLTGYSREELLSMPVAGLFEPVDREIHLKRVGDILSGKPVAANWEYRIRKKDGGRLWALINMDIAYENGLPAISRVIATDITEHKLAQELTRMQRDLAITLGKANDLNDMFELLLDSVVTIEGVDCGAVHLVDADTGAMRLAAHKGFSESFINAVSFFPPDSPYAKAVASGAPINHDYAKVQKSVGGTRKAEGVKAFVMMPLNDEGRVMGALSISSRTREELPKMVSHFLSSMSAHLGSLIARLRAERERRDAEEKYRILVENATDAICIVQDGTITFPNPVAISLTGYTQDEIVGMSFLDLLHPDEREEASLRHGKRLLGKIAGKVYNYRFIKKNGETAIAQVSGSPITWEGRPAVLMVARDVTEQKRMEEQLVHAERMEAVGTLAGGVAHDFNNLLMTIQGNVSLMLLSLPADNPLVDRLKSVESCVQSGTRLTGQLLGYARGGKYSMKTTDLNQLVESSAQLFGRAKKEIGLQMDFAADLWRVEIDRIQIEQVLLNLFVNAWHAMPGGGDIRISTENTVLSEEDCAGYGLPPGFYVKLSVADNGVGMDENIKKRIFEPFFTTRQKGSGVGLGLASSYAIIKNHNGMIHVASKPKMGSTFSIFLPATDKDPDLTPVSGLFLFKGEGVVMLVDDDPMVLDVAASMLQEMGFTVLAVNGGKAAVELFKTRAGEVRLVILDVMMPDMNGIETFKALRSMRGDVPVLLASGYSESSQTRAIVASGGAEFLQKPFDVVELSKKLHKMLEG